MNMKLHELIEQGEGKLTTGYISRFVQFEGSIPIVEITHDAPGRGPTTCGLQVPLEKLGIMKTSSRYLAKKRHPVVMYTQGPIGPPSEIYDGITGKPIHIQDQIMQMVREQNPL